ncbi:translation initiation factor IF-2 [Streptomyces sp. ASQP_92]|uniref:translation initiation factor IF-2 n=1 Tax=Streptomyces sp. ASQP_92 TaxID=2979116 RepID=UPI0021C038DC|nr:translation initiation factor IF-2 [Streptomyces sp. ASQP_92]MCT9091232.1 translation initiation factor IF-2 [Streptomyces sp. ASQP_92]
MGGSTPFEGMSHEAMLAWLDQANSGTVQGAADRLAAAAKEIRKIADDLKVRPQWVEWKGAGADAFRTWSADLANATLRLGDFSEDSSKWLGHASDAIATAQAAIPRDQTGAQGNLAAAKAAHNDPDASMIARKSTSELAALEADKEKVRQEAVAQMRKLGQAYEQSATQMNGLVRPKFPPPPATIAPDNDGSLRRTGVDLDSGGTGLGTSSPGHAAPAGSVRSGASTSAAPNPSQQPDLSSPERFVLAEAPRPARMDVDSVASLPPAVRTPGSARSALGLTVSETPVTRVSPPIFGGGLSVPSTAIGPERPSAGERSLVEPRQSRSSRNSVRLPGGSPGITGGRPVPAPQGRPNGGIPKGTVVGVGETEGHGTTRPITGAGPVGQAMGRPGAAPGHASLTPRSGVSGGSTQQSGRVAGTRAASTGAGAERGGVSGGRPVVGNAGGGGQGGGRLPRDSQRGKSRREAGDNVRGHLVEDDETWLRDDPRVVPPVID